jgi:hypothetical protein
LGSLFAKGCRGKQNGREVLSHYPTFRISSPSDYHFFGPLKAHLRGHHYENEEAVQEAVLNCLRGAGTDFYRRGTFKTLQRWQKCIDRDGFCRKVIKDAQILLASFVFVCIPYCHCRINVLITFGTTLVDNAGK